jgi:hypothetical protein
MKEGRKPPLTQTKTPSSLSSLSNFPLSQPSPRSRRYFLLSLQTHKGHKQPFIASVLFTSPGQNRRNKAIFSFSGLRPFLLSCFFAMLALRILWRLRGFRFTVLWKLLVFKQYGSRRRVQGQILLLHGSSDSWWCIPLWDPLCLPKTCLGKSKNLRTAHVLTLLADLWLTHLAKSSDFFF